MERIAPFILVCYWVERIAPFLFLVLCFLAGRIAPVISVVVFDWVERIAPVRVWVWLAWWCSGGLLFFRFGR